MFLQDKLKRWMLPIGGCFGTVSDSWICGMWEVSVARFLIPFYCPPSSVICSYLNMVLSHPLLGCDVTAIQCTCWWAAWGDQGDRLNSHHSTRGSFGGSNFKSLSQRSMTRDCGGLIWLRTTIFWAVTGRWWGGHWADGRDLGCHHFVNTVTKC